MQVTCPLLALGSDHRTVLDSPDRGHRCHAETVPSVVERSYQQRVCLSDGFARCDRYLEHSARVGDPRNRYRHGLTSTRLVIPGEPAWAVAAASRRQIRRSQLAGLAAALAVLAAGGVAVVSGALPAGLALLNSPTPRETPVPSVPSPSSTPSSTPTASPTATAAPTASAPQPTASPTAVPTSALTAAPTPPPRTYVVVQGDTLGAIAARFGTTPNAIAAANGITNPNEINPGQVLVIP